MKLPHQLFMLHPIFTKLNSIHLRLAKNSQTTHDKN
jgi:hypothetical protein